MIPKFRAWWMEQEVMCGVDVIGFSEGAITVSNENTTYEHLGLNEVILMQYTGLKDKNGVEIYEGDIVKSQNGTGGLIYKHIVEWNDFYKGFDPMRKDESYFNRDSCEVIGNIYENPEWLEAHT